MIARLDSTRLLEYTPNSNFNLRDKYEIGRLESRGKKDVALGKSVRKQRTGVIFPPINALVIKGACLVRICVLTVMRMHPSYSPEKEKKSPVFIAVLSLTVLENFEKWFPKQAAPIPPFMLLSNLLKIFN